MLKNSTFFRDRIKISALAGIIGPALFIGIFMIEGCLRQDYNPLGMFVSELSLGPRGWIQIINFIVFGTLFLVFTCGIAAEFREGKASRAGPILFAIIALCYLLSGPFVTDPVNIPIDQLSWHGIIHNILGALVFILMPISCFVFLQRFRDDPKWGSFQWWTLAAGIIITIAVILLTIGQKILVTTPNAINDLIGVFQRTAIITYLTWLFIFALGLLRRIKRSEKKD